MYRKNGIWETNLDEFDYGKFSKLINMFKNMDKARLVPKDHYKELSDDEIW